MSAATERDERTDEQATDGPKIWHAYCGAVTTSRLAMCGSVKREPRVHPGYQRLPAGTVLCALCALALETASACPSCGQVHGPL